MFLHKSTLILIIFEYCEKQKTKKKFLKETSDRL